VPYAVLGAMIFPDILTSTGHLASAAIGFAAAVILAFLEKSLLKVAVCAIVVVYVCEMIIARI
jgi:branched-subunit amino acid transport protein